MISFYKYLYAEGSAPNIATNIKIYTTNGKAKQMCPAVPLSSCPATSHLDVIDNCKNQVKVEKRKLLDYLDRFIIIHTIKICK